jgi:hypothetical protein
VTVSLLLFFKFQNTSSSKPRSSFSMNCYDCHENLPQRTSPPDHCLGVHTGAQLYAKWCSKLPKKSKQKTMQAVEEFLSSASDRTLMERVLTNGERVRIGWQHNLALGAQAEHIPLDHTLCTEHLQPIVNTTAETLNLGFGCVDVVRSRTSEQGGLDDVFVYRVLEVNTEVGVAGFLNQNPQHIPQFEQMYSDALKAAFDLDQS